MADGTGIEWTDATWNPVHGCSKVSPGCAHCYAETLSLRYGHTQKPWTPENAAENVILKPHKLLEPLKWRKPRMVFVNSMSDLFHELVPDEYLDRVFGVMWLARKHTFQVLTKRPERAREYLSRVPYLTDPRQDVVGAARHPDVWPLPNVWLGTSIENRRFVHRADALRETPAAVRFISAEPLLGPLCEWMYCSACSLEGPDPECEECDGLQYWPLQDGGNPLLQDIDWLIVGGESGPGHRRMREEWVSDLRRLADLHDTAFFFKQWGGSRPGGEALLDGREWREFPESRVVAA